MCGTLGLVIKVQYLLPFLECHTSAVARKSRRTSLPARMGMQATTATIVTRY